MTTTPVPGIPAKTVQTFEPTADSRAALQADDTPERQRWLREHTHVADEARRRGAFRGSSVPPSHADGWNDRHWSSRLLHRVGEVVAHSSAGIAAAAVVFGWAIIGFVAAFPGWWQTALYSTTGSVTFVMVFVIQHTQERQTAATQRKLDELLRVADGADNTLISLEEAPDEHLAALARLNRVDRAIAAEEVDGST